MKYLVTGGAGFIGSAVIRHLLEKTEHLVLNVDALTYAGNLSTLAEVEKSDRYQFLRADICNGQAMHAAFESFKPDIVMHFAAESHVDRSIDGPAAFIDTNIIGTYTLLETARQYWETLSKDVKRGFRFQHISTDEVYGSLGVTGKFTEQTPYDPRSPYSASKASSDHLVRAWSATYGLPVLVTNCSNNYGPFQYPEKLIPLMIINALNGEPLPIYGRGDNIRDWLHVEDHADALILVSETAKPGSSYNIGGNAERTNLQVVESICDEIDKVRPDGSPKRSLIEYVADRPGHDLRYAIDCGKIKNELGWEPSIDFEQGLKKTINWYLQEQSWWETIRAKQYDGRRLGLSQ